MDIDELLRQLQENLDDGLLNQLYAAASVREDEMILALRDHGLDVFSLGEIARSQTELLDAFADKQIAMVQRLNVISGASFGLGGFLSIAPEMVYILISLLRLAQRLSLTYGNEVATPKGRLDLWTALGRSMDVQLDFKGLESQVYRDLPILVGRGRFRDPLLIKVAQKVTMALAIRMSTRVTRLVPILGAAIGSLTNYLYLARIGKRLKEDFRTRHQLRQANTSGENQSEEIAFTLEDRG